MNANPITLSLEEAAAALSLAGNPMRASLLLEEAYGDLSQEERRAIGRSALNGLLARGYLSPSDSNAILGESLDSLVTVWKGAKNHLRLDSGRHGQPSDSLILYDVKGQVLALRINGGNLCRFEMLPDWERALAEAMEFSAPPEDGESSEKGYLLPQRTLQWARRIFQKDRQEISQYLQEGGLDGTIADRLAGDLNEDARWGVMTLGTYREHVAPIDLEHKMIVAGQRFWLITPTPSEGDEMVEIRSENPASVKAILEKWIGQIRSER